MLMLKNFTQHAKNSGTAPFEKGRKCFQVKVISLRDLLIHHKKLSANI